VGIEEMKPLLQLLPVPEAALAYFGSTATHQPAAAVIGRIPEGERHKRLLSLAGSMRDRGMEAEEIAAALLAVNNNRCQPPLPAQTVLDLAADIARRYQPAPPDPEQERIRQIARDLLDNPSAPPPPPDRARSAAKPLIISLTEFLGGSEDDATWLVDHLAARGALVIVAGLPKVGKSTFVYGMLGALTGSSDRFAGLRSASTAALLLTEEPPATVEEKADRFGLDEQQVYVLSKRRSQGRKWARIAKDAADFCRAHPEIGLVVVDTLDKFADLDAKRSEADTGVIRETIDPLYELLDLGVCVILITHQRKE
jgi:hypothetical protein